jgi:hypothetical protein
VYTFEESKLISYALLPEVLNFREEGIAIN